MTITITGTNDDDPTIGGYVRLVTEDAAATLTTSGTLTISDTDTGEAVFNAETISGTYGDLTSKRMVTGLIRLITLNLPFKL
ncbi:VCBS domain-containing protein [bacterium SCSIO 12844]|nr:VCBS domain-containing protein [bacterium SCSIO 12844]